MIRIAKMQGKEVGSLAKFARLTYLAAYRADLSSEEMQRQLQHKLSDAQFSKMGEVDEFFVAHSEGKMVGFAQTGLVDPGPRNSAAAARIASIEASGSKHHLPYDLAGQCRSPKALPSTGFPAGWPAS